MDKGIIIVVVFVVGLLAGGVFLLQGNDTEGGVQFIEVPSQPQQAVVGDREDIPEPNEGVGRGRQAVELPEGEKILLSPEEEAEIAEEAEQAAIEAERREERQRDLEERNAQAREVAKVSSEVDRDEATAVGLSWISSFVLTIS